MKRAGRKKLSILARIVISAFFLSLFAGTGQADSLRGPAFLPDRQLTEMDEGWSEKPVEYIHASRDADLVVDVNQQFYPVFEPIILSFAREHDLKIVVEKGTCGKSAGKLARKEVDIGGFCCPPGENDYLPGIQYHTLGISPLAILTYPDNPVKGVTLDEARKIFQGEIQNWSAVGGDSIPIRLIASLHCPTRPGHWRLLLANKDLYSTTLMEVEDMTDQIVLISSTRGAIGYETLWVAERFKDKGKVKALEINGLHPQDLENVVSGAYPIYRVYNVTTWQGEHIAKPYAAELVQYLMEKVESLDSKYGLAPASKLREAGWQFQGNELIGEPQ